MGSIILMLIRSSGYIMGFCSSEPMEEEFIGSSDGENTWISSNSGIPLGSTGRFAYSLFEFEPGKVVCGTPYGIYYSTNSGVSWIYRSIGCSNKRAKDLTVDENGNLFAGIDLNGGVYMSTNTGNNWTPIGLTYSIYTLGWDSDLRLCAGGANGLSRFNLRIVPGKKLIIRVIHQRKQTFCH